MSKGKWITTVVAVGVIAFVLGFCISPGGDDVWMMLSGFKSRVAIVNVSGHDLKDVVVTAGDDRQVIGTIPKGERRYATPRPVDSTDLSVEFTCDGERYRAELGGIGPRYEERTGTILEDGRQVIISYECSDAATDLVAAEKVGPTDAP